MNHLISLSSLLLQNQIRPKELTQLSTWDSLRAIKKTKNILISPKRMWRNQLRKNPNNQALGVIAVRVRRTSVLQRSKKEISTSIRLLSQYWKRTIWIKTWILQRFKQESNAQHQEHPTLNEPRDNRHPGNPWLNWAQDKPLDNLCLSLTVTSTAMCLSAANAKNKKGPLKIDRRLQERHNDTRY